MVYVDTQKCIGCGACEKDCLLGEINVVDGKAVPNNKTCFDCGHCVAICPVGAVTPAAGEDEVVPMTAQDCELDPDHLMNSFRFRRTIRTFEDKKIDRQILEKVLEAGRISPTGMNSQEIRFVVFDKDLRILRTHFLSANQGLDVVPSALSGGKLTFIKATTTKTKEPPAVSCSFDYWSPETSEQ